MNILLRSLAFGFMTGLYSVAVTYSTVGFPIATLQDWLKVGALFIVSGVGGVYAYRRDPESVWKLGPGAKAAIVLFIGLGLWACAGKQPVGVDEPLNRNQCDALAQAAYRASSANDVGATSIFMAVAKKGGCF